jgi:hypothetical protein
MAGIRCRGGTPWPRHLPKHGPTFPQGPHGRSASFDNEAINEEGTATECCPLQSCEHLIDQFGDVNPGCVERAQAAVLLIPQ